MEEHALTHLGEWSPWCTICVSSRGRDAGHFQAVQEERTSLPVDELPIVEMDYTYMEKIVVLDVYEKGKHLGAGTVAIQKGAVQYVVNWVIRRLDAWGLKEIQLRGDKEASVQAVMRQVKQERKDSTYL